MRHFFFGGGGGEEVGLSDNAGDDYENVTYKVKLVMLLPASNFIALLSCHAIRQMWAIFSTVEF